MLFKKSKTKGSGPTLQSLHNCSHLYIEMWYIISKSINCLLVSTLLQHGICKHALGIVFTMFKANLCAIIPLIHIQKIKCCWLNFIFISSNLCQLMCIFSQQPIHSAGCHLSECLYHFGCSLVSFGYSEYVILLLEIYLMLQIGSYFAVTLFLL